MILPDLTTILDDKILPDHTIILLLNIEPTLVTCTSAPGKFSLLAVWHRFISFKYLTIKILGEAQYDFKELCRSRRVKPSSIS